MQVELQPLASCFGEAWFSVNISHTKVTPYFHRCSPNLWNDKHFASLSHTSMFHLEACQVSNYITTWSAEMNPDHRMRMGKPEDVERGFENSFACSKAGVCGRYWALFGVMNVQVILSQILCSGACSGVGQTSSNNWHFRRIFDRVSTSFSDYLHRWISENSNMGNGINRNWCSGRSCGSRGRTGEIFNNKVPTVQ